MPRMMSSEKYDGTVKTAEEAKRMCVLGNRILAFDKVLDAFGHVSVRNPENPDTFFIAWATSPEFVREEDLLLCDFAGNILSEDSRKPYGERILHSRIYKARPDVNAICHGHPVPLLPFVCSSVPLRPVSGGGAAIFYDGVPFLREWDTESGLAISTVAAGDDLAKVLGPHRAALIRSHGMVAVGDCVQQMVTVANALVSSADTLIKVLLLGGEPYTINADEARMAASSSLGAVGIERSWNYKLKKAREVFRDI